MELASDEQKTLWKAICHGNASTGHPLAVSRSAHAVLENFQEDQAARAAQLGKSSVARGNYKAI
jgi:hypothetical protein